MQGKEMPYQLNKSHLIICILAALVITAGFVIHHLMGSPFGLFTMALWVSTIIVIFYFIGHIARHILISGVFVLPEEELLEEENMEMEDSEEMPEGVMEYAAVEPTMVEQELIMDDTFETMDDRMYSESVTDDLIENVALSDAS